MISVRGFQVADTTEGFSDLPSFSYELSTVFGDKMVGLLNLGSDPSQGYDAH